MHDSTFVNLLLAVYRGLTWLAALARANLCSARIFVLYHPLPRPAIFNDAVPHLEGNSNGDKRRWQGQGPLKSSQTFTGEHCGEPPAPLLCAIKHCLTEDATSSAEACTGHRAANSER